MNRKKLLLIIALCIYCTAHTQIYKKTMLHSGENLNERPYYLFPIFIDGIVKLKTGGTLNSKMNFNTILCAMEFINTNNDTLVMSKPEDIDSIIFKGSVFFYNDGYYQVLASSDSVKLMVLHKVTYQPLKVGALGLISTAGTGTQTYSSIVTILGEKNLILNEDIEVTNETAYILMHNNTETIKANKAGFSKFFHSKEINIQLYLKQNKINFNKEDDLIKFFDYCIH